MTKQDLSNDRTKMLVDGEVLTMERTFDAPQDLVWTVVTSAEHISHWWGPHGTTTKVIEMDVRPGGAWRWVNVFEEGEAPFKGEYLEVVAPERFVRTSIFDVAPMNEGPGAVETLTLEHADGKTKLAYVTRFPSEDVLDFALSQDMSTGALQQFDRLAALLDTIS